MLFPIQSGNSQNKFQDDQYHLAEEELTAEDQRILKCEHIIYNPESSNKDIYNAYLEKYIIYKGLFNYTQAIENLELARNVGLLTNDKEKVETRYKVERLLVHFDLLEFDKVIEMMPTISESNIKYLDVETQGFYYSALAYMDIRQENYVEGDQYLNKALKILEKGAPKHLPLVYRKKISLYKKQGLHDKVIESFDKGLYYAEKYKVDIYIIAMYDDISFYYSEIGDFEKALEATREVGKLATKFNGNNKSGRLQLLEKKLLEQRRNRENENQNKIRKIYGVLITTLVITLSLLFYFYSVAKRKRKIAELEINSIRSDLERVTQELNESGQNKINLNNYDLTDRQNQIIALVKQGKTNKEIGADLFISENTVKYHLKIIYDILKIGSRTDL
ncbi:helix-turn-helix transcriptional regulator [Winogradskyella sp. F6397]|uniref:Helix-turn-helix transcriptional regulator n=1 Tax=Winogradskyella marina TaxID=2785530 RepID=A0ABS0EET0_9FLAO|nr:helix-turn-helix transcriptional regulator [Winogradskyella marina]MBF8148899.1 helix-turn-helix transcriptional regulator [Winogradskyella marina]